MRLVGAIVLVLLSISQVFAQTNPSAGDKVVTDPKDYSWDDWKQRKNKHWQGLDIGLNTLIYDDNTDIPPQGYKELTIDYGRSFYFGLNLGEKDFQVVGEYVKIVTGIGFDFYNFQLRGNSYMFKNGDSLAFAFDSTNSFRNNNMKSGHVTVPLLLGFNTSPKNSTSFHIAFGAIFSYRLSGKQKVKYDVGEQTNILKLKSEMFQDPWKVAATVRVGYGNFHLFANYALTDFWLSGSAPQARSFVAGVKVLPW